MAKHDHSGIFGFAIAENNFNCEFLSTDTPNYTFIETGLKFRFGEKQMTTFRWMTVSLPINLTTRIHAGKKWYVAPQIGLSVKSNIVRKEYNPYNPYKVNNMQLSGQIGLNVYHKEFFCGLQYGRDFTPIFRHTGIYVNELEFICGINL